MNKRKRFMMSQAAHRRLSKKNKHLFNVLKREPYQQKFIYHDAILLRQKKAGRVFTKKEREDVFQDTISVFY